MTLDVIVAVGETANGSELEGCGCLGDNGASVRSRFPLSGIAMPRPRKFFLLDSPKGKAIKR